jgi:hypothetical protein
VLSRYETLQAASACNTCRSAKRENPVVPRSLVDARRAEAERLRRNVDEVTRDEVDNELDRKVLRLPGDPWHDRGLPLVGRNMIGGAMIGTVPGSNLGLDDD